MIGMMNNASNSVEFYGGHHEEGSTKHEEDRKFSEVHQKTEVIYTKDGRKIVDGKLEIQTPKELWTKTLLQGAVNHVINSEDRDEIRDLEVKEQQETTQNQ